jgi:hypothetical protein
MYARHHHALALEELGGLNEVALLEDQNPLMGPCRQLGGHERSTGPGAHHEDVGLENEMVWSPHNAGGFEIGTKLVVRNDTASQVGDVRVGLDRHVERRGPSTIRVGLRQIEQPWARIIHHLPHDPFVRVERHCPDEFRAAEDVPERADVAIAQVQEIAIGVVGAEVPKLEPGWQAVTR